MATAISMCKPFEISSIIMSSMAYFEVLSLELAGMYKGNDNVHLVPLVCLEVGKEYEHMWLSSSG